MRYLALAARGFPWLFAGVLLLLACSAQPEQHTGRYDLYPAPPVADCPPGGCIIQINTFGSSGLVVTTPQGAFRRRQQGQAFERVGRGKQAATSAAFDTAGALLALSGAGAPTLHGRPSPLTVPGAELLLGEPTGAADPLVITHSGGFAPLTSQGLSRSVELGAVPVSLLATPGGSTLLATFGKGVFASRAGGPFKPASDGLESLLVTDLARGAGSKIYAATIDGGLYRTDPGTLRWERLGEPDLPLLSAVAVWGNTLVVGTPTGLLQSTDGRSFAPAPGVQGFVTTLVTSKGGDLLVGTWGLGLLRAAAGQSAFESLDVADQGRRMTAIVAAPGGWVVGTGRGEVYRFSDGEDRWTRAGGVSPPLAVEQLDVGSDGAIYAGTSHGLYRLRPGGSVRLLGGACCPFAATDGGVVVARTTGNKLDLLRVSATGKIERPSLPEGGGSPVPAGGLRREPGGRLVLFDALPPLVSTDGGRHFALGGPKIMGARWLYPGKVVVAPSRTLLAESSRDRVLATDSGKPFEGSLLEIPSSGCVAPLPDGSIVSLSGGVLRRARPHAGQPSTAHAAAISGGAAAGDSTARAPTCSALAVIADGSVVLIDEAGHSLKRTRDFLSFEPLPSWADAPTKTAPAESAEAGQPGSSR